MKISVRYYTRSGNTKKLAEAIGETVGVSAETVDTALEEKADIVFLGSSYYGFDADDHVKRFIKDNSGNIGKIVCFGTSAILGSTKGCLKKTCDEAGVTLSEEEFHCRGSFGPMHKGRPNADDINAVKAFAKKIIGKA